VEAAWLWRPAWQVSDGGINITASASATPSSSAPSPTKREFLFSVFFFNYIIGFASVQRQQQQQRFTTSNNNRSRQIYQ
jgi:hypothetical protein